MCEQVEIASVLAIIPNLLRKRRRSSALSLSRKNSRVRDDELAAFRIEERLQPPRCDQLRQALAAQAQLLPGFGKRYHGARQGTGIIAYAHFGLLFHPLSSILPLFQPECLEHLALDSDEESVLYLFDWMALLPASRFQHQSVALPLTGELEERWRP
jgi:hypothetical protein